MDITQLLPERSAEDILAGRLPVVFGGKRYDLAVRSIADNRRWKEALETRLQGRIEGLDGDDTSGLMDAIEEANADLIDIVCSYDSAGVLPPQAELEEVATPGEMLAALAGVWIAANPLLAMALAQQREPGAPSSKRTKRSRASTAGGLVTSSPN